MIAAIIIVLVIVGLAYLGTLLSQYPGYVEIGLSSGSFQMPLWYFLLALLLAIGVAMLVFKIVWTFFRLPAISRRFGKNRRNIKAAHLLQKGMLAMGKGKWKRAENLLTKGARVSYKGKQDTGLFLTIAAQAAQQQGANARRDKYLLEARQLAAEGDDTFTAALAEAQLHLETNEPSKALSVLEPHRTLNYDNQRLQVLQSDAYEQLEQFADVWHLLKGLRKNYANKAAYHQRQVEVAKALFDSSNSTLDNVEKVWSELPKAEKKDETLILSYVSALIGNGEKEKAENILAREIRNSYANSLVHAYTQLEVGSSRERLDKVINWVRAHPDSAYLNYAAAKLALQSDELEKAKEYAERSVKAQPLPEGLALLGKIYEAMGQGGNALQAYRTSLTMTYAEHQAVSGEVLPSPETKTLTVDESPDNHQAVAGDKNDSVNDKTNVSVQKAGLSSSQ